MHHLRLLLANLATTLIAIAVSILLLMIGLYLAHYPAHLVLAEWLRGAFGSKFDIMVALKNSTPLILTGLAAGIAFRSGVFNIGAEGQALLGALAATALAIRFLPNLPSALAIPLALLVAIIAGAFRAAIASLLDRYLCVPVVLSTILLNFIAVQFLGICLEGPLHAAGTEVVQSDSLPLAYQLPALSDLVTAFGHHNAPPVSNILAALGDLGSLHIGILIALAVAALLWLLQSRTSFGFELQAVGLNPTAAKLAGMPVKSREISVMLLSGAAAGLAGAIQTLGVSHNLGPDSPGYGYIGIAVALLGRLHPAAIVLAALFFAFLDQGATNVEISQYQLPHEVADIVKGLAVLLLLIAAALLTRLRNAKRSQ